MVYKWNCPESIVKEIDVKSLNNGKFGLEYYHEQMHVFWKKIEEGIWFEWTFKEVYLMHKEIVIEMLRRKIEHLKPINELDNISPAKNRRELLEIINSIKQKI